MQFRAMTSEIQYTGQLRTEAVHLQSGTRIYTDAPTDNKGKGESFSPTDLVATALGSCMLSIMAIRAMDMENVVLEGTRVEVTKIMLADPRRIGTIRIRFDFPPTLTLQPHQKTILEKAAHTCPVAYSLHPDLKTEVSFGWSE